MAHDSEIKTDHNYGRFLSLITGTDFFFREILAAFYGIYILFFLAFNIFDNSALVQFAFRCALFFCAAGILFGTGWQLGRMDHKDPETKRTLVSYALISYLFYAFMGIILHVLAYNEECLKTIKNVLFAILIPNDASIFLTCALVFLIFSLAGDRIMTFADNKKGLGALCILGLLTSLIPEGLIGYGIFGLLIGGDTSGAVPVSFFLTALFGGLILGKEDSPRFLTGGNVIRTLALLITGQELHRTVTVRTDALAAPHHRLDVGVVQHLV